MDAIFGVILDGAAAAAHAAFEVVMQAVPAQAVCEVAASALPTEASAAPGPAAPTDPAGRRDGV
ncbi:hypothetical protein [Methylobacterium sp. NEAU K]|uniref:hypothetical protein n=1 Tax=Methylobacterium sp. NEAU K TaxID=3064946 RepID=UPI002734820C|nr:hypothetical protein [Methylobacterium sp. NEAU K]MDP4003767.1 hypothetical protein [Methylobacterium sp. NEAU K]